MKRLSRTLRSFGAVLALVIGFSAAACAADLSDPVLLVASSALDGTPFEQAVVLAAPLPIGGHIGFIVNRPTALKLQKLFPDDPAVRNVNEPVYFGGPGLMPGVFALTHAAPRDGGVVVPLMPGLVAVLDAETVDRIIATTPNNARYFVGLMYWGADELADEVAQHAWEVRPADVDTVLGVKSPGLWNSLRSPMANVEMDATPAG